MKTVLVVSEVASFEGDPVPKQTFLEFWENNDWISNDEVEFVSAWFPLMKILGLLIVLYRQYVEQRV